MEVFTGSFRGYRGRVVPGPGETAFQCVVEQTDLWVLASADFGREMTAWVEDLRAGLKNYILIHPEFQASLVPVEVDAGAPALVKDMARAAAACGVGPMAAVAGAMAQAVAARFAGASPDLIVENGGDAFLYSTRERVAGLLAKPGQGPKLGIRLAPGDFPLALCTSSATIGHSLSFGVADAITVKAKSGAVADAAATYIGNQITGPHALGPAVESAGRLRRFGVSGVFAQCQEMVAVWGDMDLVVLD